MLGVRRSDHDRSGRFDRRGVRLSGVASGDAALVDAGSSAAGGQGSDTRQVGDSRAPDARVSSGHAAADIGRDVAGTPGFAPRPDRTDGASRRSDADSPGRAHSAARPGRLANAAGSPDCAAQRLFRNAAALSRRPCQRDQRDAGGACARCIDECNRASNAERARRTRECDADVRAARRDGNADARADQSISGE